MEIFWNTIARYNAATWPWQIAIVAAAAVLTVLLYLRPTQNVKRAMKLFMAMRTVFVGRRQSNRSSRVAMPVKTICAGQVAAL